MHGRVVGVLAAGALAATAAAQHGPAPTWLVEFGTPHDDWASGIAPDGAGGIFVAGDTAGDLGGPSAGYPDAWVARYTADGERLWATQLGTEMTEWEAYVAPDGAGGVFATGRTYGSFIGMPRVDDTDIWLARLDAAGELLWVTEFGAKWQDISRALIADGSGGVYLAGKAESSLNGAGTGLGAFVTRHDSEGQQVWVNQFGVSSGDIANALDSHGAGGVFVAGTTNGGLSGPSAGRADAFIARLNGDGELLWVRQFGTDEGDQAHGVAVDGAGGAFVAGHTRGHLAAPSQGLEDAFIARYDSEGNQLWITQFGARRSDRVTAAASDGAGGVVVTASTEGDLGGARGGYQDALIVRADSDGNIKWITQIGSPGSRMFPAGIAIDSAREVFVAGANFLYPDDDQAWLARFPLDAGCYADCDTSGELDLFDLLCFQDLFAAQAPRADCDFSGELDFFDFLCFQNEFAAGCP